MTPPLAIGIDLGGTQVRAALVDSSGAVLQRVIEPTNAVRGPDGALDQFSRLIDELTASETANQVSCIGVAAAGPLDSEAGTIIHIPTLPGWDNFPLRETLAKRQRLPVFIEGDAIAAAYGEWRFGAGQGLRNLVYVTVSTGIGGGVIVDGHLLHGRRGMAGHVGHIRIAENGPLCSCGVSGCFEALASGTALSRRAREAVRNCQSTVLAKLAQFTARDVVVAARDGDRMAVELLHEEAGYLGVGFTGLIHAYSPEKLIMGGGISHAFDLLEDDILAVIRRDALPPFREVAIAAATLGDNSGVIGAASLALLRSSSDRNSVG